MSNPITPNSEPLDPTQVVALEEANVGHSEETTYVETPEHQAAEQFLAPRQTTSQEALQALRNQTGTLYNDEVSTDYIEQAIKAVQIEHLDHATQPAGVPESRDLFVVWFVKVLGNWKALVGQKTTTNYFEVTFNGAKNEVYVDRYAKVSNTAIPGDQL